MVSPRADHRRDRSLPPGNEAGRRQVRPDPAGDHIAVHVPHHQHSFIRVRGNQVGGGQGQRDRQVDQVGDGHIKGQDAAEDTDRGRDRHEGAAAGTTTTITAPRAAQPGGAWGRTAILRSHNAVFARRRVLSWCL